MYQESEGIMIKNEIPYIIHNKNEHRCYLAGYINPVMHKWCFVIDGVNSGIKYGQSLEFMGLKLRVTYTLRRKAKTTSMFNNTSGAETYIESWIDSEGK